MSIEIAPDVLQYQNGKWIITIPFAQSGGGMLAIGTEWCGYCKQLKNVVKNAQMEKNFDFFWMDGEKTPDHEAKSKQMNIKGYPTIFYINRNGVLHEYNGGRTAEDIAKVFHK